MPKSQGICFSPCCFRAAMNQTKMAPKAKRMALKLKGSKLCMPKRWATKAKPQIAAVTISRKVDRFYPLLHFLLKAKPPKPPTLAR